MNGRLLFLGTGASLGVPVVGCECAVCLSPSPFNKRLRPSALIKIGEKHFLIDPGPDFRLQALRSSIKRLDGVFITHAHHDHTAGIDDLRAIYYKAKRPLPTLLSAATAEDVRLRYYYLFQSKQAHEKCGAQINLHLLPGLEGDALFEGLTIQYMTYEQGGMVVNGYRFGNLAYVSDIRHFPASVFDQLKGVKTLVVSALRRDASPLHFSVDEAVQFADQVKAESVWLTHLSHDLDYDQTNAYLPAHVRVAYDGLEIEFLYHDR